MKKIPNPEKQGPGPPEAREHLTFAGAANIMFTYEIFGFSRGPRVFPSDLQPRREMWEKMKNE